VCYVMSCTPARLSTDLVGFTLFVQVVRAVLHGGDLLAVPEDVEVRSVEAGLGVATDLVGEQSPTEESAFRCCERYQSAIQLFELYSVFRCRSVRGCCTHREGHCTYACDQGSFPWAGAWGAVQGCASSLSGAIHPRE